MTADLAGSQRSLTAGTARVGATPTCTRLVISSNLLDMAALGGQRTRG